MIRVYNTNVAFDRTDADAKVAWAREACVTDVLFDTTGQLIRFKTELLPTQHEPAIEPSPQRTTRDVMLASGGGLVPRGGNSIPQR